ncbi:MAG: nuclear transport factor 2 family protein [Candidatus Dormibacteraeota bacterium]|nr:nuclear transport factor 2 family protein [Candidatus Dormibacteraeota bacterium]
MALADAQGWLDRYVAAWRANDPAMIGDLFTVDAVYYANPFDDGLRGRQAIVDEWLHVQMPKTFEGAYSPQLVVGDQVFASGTTRYFNEDRSLHSEWGNAFLLRLDETGCCSEYREWYMQRAEVEPA